MINFKRASAATYINKQGVLSVAQANEPRFEEKGILIEGLSTNLIPFSVDMTKAKQTNVHSISSSNEPFLGGFAQLVEFKPVKDARIEYPLTGSVITFSVWIKGTKGEVVDIRAFEGVPNNVLHTFTGDWDLATTTTPQAPTGRNVWCAILQPTEKALTPFYIGCVQAEALPFATSYIPTSGTAVTRDADKLYVKDTDFFKGEVTVSLDFDTFKPSGDALAFGLDNGFNYLGNEGKLFQSRLPTLVVHPRVVVNKYTRVTAVRSSSSFGVYLNGVYVETKSTNLPNLTGIFCIGGRSKDIRSTVLWGHVKGFKIWEVALTPEQVSTL